MLFNVVSVAASTTNRPDRIGVATQWQLMWWRFRKHRLAMIGGIVTILIYVIALFAEFMAPFPTDTFSAKFTYAPPQPLRGSYMPSLGK